MKILVTGGGGFIGSSLVRKLMKEGHKVSVLDDFSTGKKESIMNGGKYICDIFEGSVLDEELVRKLITENDMVYRLGAVVGVKYSLEDTFKSLEVNLEGTRKIAIICKKNRKKLVFVSSSGIYGRSLLPVSSEEDDIVIGNTEKKSWACSYSKICGELYCKALASHGLEVKIVRFFNCVGKRQVGTYGMVLPRFIEAAIKGNDLVVYGEGAQTRTFIYVENLINLLIQYVNSDNSWNGSVRNIGGAEEISIKELAEEVIRILNSKSKIVYVPFENIYGEEFEETMRRKPNIEKLVKIIGKFELTTLDKIIKIISGSQEEKMRIEETKKKQKSSDGEVIDFADMQKSFIEDAKEVST